MADSIYARRAAARKTRAANAPIFPHPVREPVPPTHATHHGVTAVIPVWSHDVPEPVSGVAFDALISIMTALEEGGGVSEIGDLAAALPDGDGVSTILALVNAGRLALDTSRPLDAHTRVMRVG